MVEIQRRTEWLSNLLLTVLVFTGESIGIHVENLQGMKGILHTARILTLPLMALFMIRLIVIRKNPPRRDLRGIFFLTFLWLFCTSTLYHFQYAHWNLWVPFIDQKVFLFGLSLLVAGPYWINIFWIVLFSVQTIALWTLVDIGDKSRFAAVWEPWYTILYGIVCLALVVIRILNERGLQKLSAEKAALQHTEYLARVFVSIRDLANTPIQNLIILSEVLHKENNEEAMGQIHRAAERLRSLSQIFKSFAESYTWSGEAPMTEEEILKSLKNFSGKERNVSSSES